MTTDRPRHARASVLVEGTLRDAMIAIDRGAAEIAIVVDENNVVVGILTDGDVRRAILRGVSVDAPLQQFVVTDFGWVSPDALKEEVLELMQSRAITQVPVLDGKRRLVGLHVLRELLSPTTRINEAVIMVGGKGTRLRPMTERVPKPLIHVGGRPIAERLIALLVTHGIRKIHLAINYLGELVENYFGDGKRFGCSIHYLREKEPLDTAGALSLLDLVPAEPLIVLNGDLITQVNIGNMIDSHVVRKNEVTIGVTKYFHTVPYGCLHMEGNQVKQIREKPCLEQWINSGIYVVSSNIIQKIPKDTPYTMPRVVEQLIANGESVGWYEIEGPWLDVGNHERLTHAESMYGK